VNGDSNNFVEPLPKEHQSEVVVPTLVDNSVKEATKAHHTSVNGEVPSTPSSVTGDGDTVTPTGMTPSSEKVGAPPTDKSQLVSSSDHDEDEEALPTKLNQSDDNNQKVEALPIQISQLDCSSGNNQPPPTDIGQEDCSDNLKTKQGSCDPGSMDVNDGTSMCGPQLPVSDRMQYLTESCSFGDSDDYLTLTTPDSQMTSSNDDVTMRSCNDDMAMMSHNDVISNDVCHDEDPLSVERKSPDEGAIANRGRQKLHDCLQKKAAIKYPSLLKKINDIINDLESCSNSECDDMVTIIYDAFDYHVTMRN